MKDYRHQANAACSLDTTCRDSVRCRHGDVEDETVMQKAKQELVKEISGEPTQFVVPVSGTRTDRVLGDETNLPCKRNLLSSTQSLKSHSPTQVHFSFICRESYNLAYT